LLSVRVDGVEEVEAFKAPALTVEKDGETNDEQ